VVDALIAQAQNATRIETAAIALRALDRVLLWGFYHIPLNMPDVERFMYRDKFGRPNDVIASYEYLNDGQARVIDSWWLLGQESK
jgi:ABC-type oligopeptide transport system substrate-binding subunit